MGNTMKKICKIFALNLLALINLQKIKCNVSKTKITASAAATVFVIGNINKSRQLLKNNLFLDETYLLKKEKGKKIWNVKTNEWSTTGNSQEKILEIARSWSDNAEYATSPIYLITFVEKICRELEILDNLEERLTGPAFLITQYKSFLKNSLFILLKKQINNQIQKINNLHKNLEFILKSIQETNEFKQQSYQKVANRISVCSQII
jgi:hypothetical protein